MFERVVLRKPAEGDVLTLGDVAEAMLFYRSVHIVLDMQSLCALIDQIGGRGLLLILERPNITATYFEETPSTLTRKIGAIEHYDFGGFTLVGSAKGEKFKDHQQLFAHFLMERNHPKGEAWRIAGQLAGKLKFQKLFGERLVPGGLSKATLEDVFDEKYFTRAMSGLLRALPGGDTQTSDLRFEAFKTESGFHAISNVDFVEVNLKRSQLAVPLEPIGMAHVLSSLLFATGDLALAAHYGGDFFTSAQSSVVIHLKAKELLVRAGIHQSERGAFNEIVLEDSPSLKAVMNIGERSLKEFLTLLDKSQAFRHWLSSKNPDESLVREYFRDVSKEGWMQSLPARGVRYFLAAALSTKLPGLAELFSAADTFLLDKMIKGWRPNHFVEKTLQPFLRQADIGD